MNLPGLDKAKPREECTATLLAECEPYLDSRAFARMVLSWWLPEATWSHETLLLEQWTASLRKLFSECKRCECNMEIRLWMKGSQPAVEVIRIYDPKRPQRKL